MFLISNEKYGTQYDIVCFVLSTWWQDGTLILSHLFLAELEHQKHINYKWSAFRALHKKLCCLILDFPKMIFKREQYILNSILCFSTSFLVLGHLKAEIVEARNNIPKLSVNYRISEVTPKEMRLFIFGYFFYLLPYHVAEL